MAPTENKVSCSGIPFFVLGSCSTKAVRLSCSPCQTLYLVLQVSLGAGAKDELHVVEAEALDYEGKQITVTLASLKMSVQPTVSFSLIC